MPTGWELTLRGHLLVALASLASCGAWMTGDTYAALAAALLISPLLVDLLWRAGGLPPLDVELRERRTQAGSLFQEVVTLRNASTRRAAFDLYVMEPRTGTRAGAAHLEALGPGQTTTVTLPGRVWRRGRFAERVLVYESCHPLGLVRNHAEITCDSELISEPARVAVPADLVQAVDDHATDPAPLRPRGAQEFYALREYRYGEDARGVHALRSAAAATLVRRVTRGQHERDACLVLDLRCPPGHGARRGNRRFEWSLSAAATLIDELPARGTSLTCFVLGTKWHRRVLTTPQACDDQLTCLAGARPTVHASLDPALLDTIRAHGTCLWIPAGGFPARDERDTIGDVRLITPEGQR